MAQAEINKLQAATAWDSKGKKLGDVNDVHLEKESGIPAWVTVSLGLLNSRKHYVPLANSRFEGDDLHLAWTKKERKRRCGGPEVKARRDTAPPLLYGHAHSGPAGVLDA